jgi:hypothetical protein
MESRKKKWMILLHLRNFAGTSDKVVYFLFFARIA